MTKTKTTKCILCGTPFTGFGHNPAPISRIGRCCDDCNTRVILSRLHYLAGIGRDHRAPLKLA